VLSTINKILIKKVLATVLASLVLLSAAPFANPTDSGKRMAVYSPVAVYSLPVLDHAGREYVGLLELLEPLGRVSSQSEGQRWKLRFNAIDAEFAGGKTRGRIRGHDVDLTAPFLVEDARGLVPLSTLPSLLPRFLGAPVNFHESARRLFIGDVAIQPSFRLDAANPQLTLSFNAPVNPMIATEPGQLRMVFKRDPVVSPGSQSISFDNKIITHATYSENNGDAELDVTASQPLTASFSSDRKTITISAVTISAVQAASATAGVAGKGVGTGTAAGFQNQAQSPPAASSAPAIAPRPVVVVDPAHGGEERGAALTDSLAEKDVTLGFARLLRHELELRGFAVNLLRDADTTLTLDQRANAANAAHAVIYISLHADSLGSGARVYTALLPVEGPSNGMFHPWNAAQAPALPLSREVAAAITLQLQKKEYPAHAFSASLRPLNNVLSPAVAVELAPGENGIEDLTSASYQQRAAAAIADAVASVHERLEGPSGDRVIGSSGNLKSEAFDLRSPDGPITRSPNLARSPDLTMVNP
jgi:N-acetylmuramoyl-L-alanine amidase